MNEDHAADTLVMCQGVGGHTKASAARMVDFDGTGADFSVTVEGVEVPLRIAWERPLSERAEVRPEIVRIYHASREKLGLPDTR
ncbi:MAG TPA: DUF2470 domain-containing protein [Candidatus Stackebrandtia excrementipullorum]|nr:DUF2470 domain-containing protein [Candidatus Stackebrandtia excrementipullorum]